MAKAVVRTPGGIFSRLGMVALPSGLPPPEFPEGVPGSIMARVAREGSRRGQPVWALVRAGLVPQSLTMAGRTDIAPGVPRRGLVNCPECDKTPDGQGLL